MTPAPEISDEIVQNTSMFDRWHNLFFGNTLDPTERQNIGIWKRILDSDAWLEAVSKQGLEPLLVSNFKSLNTTETTAIKTDKVYIIATFFTNETQDEFLKSNLRDRVQPEIFIKSLKAEIDTEKLEADFGTFILNIAGIIDPGCVSSISLFANIRLSSFKYSQPGKSIQGQSASIQSRWRDRY